MKKLSFLFAMIFAVNMAMAQNNESTTDVDGNNNLTTVNQVGMENDADVTVDGNQNNALIQQGNFGGGSVQSNYAEASIEQIGNKNLAEVKQRQGFASGTAVNSHSIYQEGNENEGWLTTFNGGNSGSITQVGSFNWAKGKQSNGPDNSIVIYQEGNNNDAEVNQENSDENSSAIVNQVGNNNWTSVDQSGGKNHEYIENTSGNWNEVTAVQRTSWAKMVLTIDGNSNIVNSDQEHNDKAYVDLIGNSNTFDLLQDYNANHVGASVTGNSNDIDVDQTGAHNHVTTLGTNAFAKDGIVIVGNSNMVDIDQMTDMNQTDVSIMGANNQSVVSQQ
jgi:hypothetical protein